MSYEMLPGVVKLTWPEGVYLEFHIIFRAR